MGGDHAPDEVVRGVAQLSLEAPHIQSLLVGDAAFPECRNHVVVDVQVMPVRRHLRHQLLGQRVEITVGVVRQHHLVGVPALAHLRHDVDPVFER